MMLLPFTLVPSFSTHTSDLNSVAFLTKWAAALAWSPSLFLIVKIPSIIALTPSSPIEHIRGKIYVLLPISGDEIGKFAQLLALPVGDQLDEHGQVHPGNHLDPSLLQEGEADVRRRSAEHVGQDDHPVAGVDLLERAL